MKKILLIACLCGLSFAAFAQEEKTPAPEPASAELQALQTAAGLVQYGYANSSATALIEAARIIGTTPVQPGEFTAVASPEVAVDPKETAVSYDPAQLLADAKKFAGKDKTVLALAKRVEKEIAKSGETRGAVGGPQYAEGRVYSNSSKEYTCRFWAGELAEVGVIGDGDTDLDLYIYDSNDNLIAYDSDYTDQCYCRWVPAWTDTFRIKIVNRGSVYNEFVLVTN